MKFIEPGQGRMSSSWPQLQRLMKLTFFLLLATALSVSARTFSQKVTITGKNMRLEEVFEQIRQQTGLAFMMDRSLPGKIAPITLHEEAAPVTRVLDKCLKGSNYTYQIRNNFIVITNAPGGANATPSIPGPEKAASEVPAPTLEIHGLVTDNKGAPLEGASIRLTGEHFNKGSVADASGAFNIANIPPGEYTIEVSLIGYTKYNSHLHVNDATAPLHIRLTPTPKALEETVVIAYGVQKKIDLTGAVSSIGSKELDDRPLTNVTNALQGTMSGVTVVQNSSQPGKDAGAINIRGIGTLNNSNPMVVVDGLISSLNDVNPNDIATISVLKDAASASIYGSRAANGVIVITTKKGRKGHLQVHYDAYVGKQKATRLPDFLPSWQQASLYNEALANEGAPPHWTAQDIQEFKDGSDTTGAHPNTDWLGLYYTGSGIQHNHYLSLNGGDEKTQYMLSLGYFDQDGIVKGTNFQKYSARFNISSAISKKASVFANVGYTYAPFAEPISSYPGSPSLSLITFVINQISNTVPYKYPNGYYGAGANGNPIAWLESGSFHKTQAYTLTGNVGGDLEILKGLHFKPNFGYRLNINQGQQFVKDIQYYDHLTGQPTRYQGPNNLTNNYNNTTYTNLQALLEYQHNLDQHHFKALAGYSQEYTGYSENSLYRQNFLNNAISQINAGPVANQTNAGLANQVALRSAFGRLNYDYQDTYIFEANLRYDGSSRFAPSNQWGLFPSFSGGWNISREEFFQPLRSVVSDLKLRGDWGKLGNQNVAGNYPAIATISPNQDYSFNQVIASGIAPANGANPNITWETTTTTDYGLDAGFFGNSLSLSVDYFIKNTSNILLALPIGAPYSLKPPYQNAGAVSNKGWEFTLSYKGKLHDLSYNLSGNATFVTNRITDLKNSGPYINGSTFQQVGYPIQAFYGYISEGIFQTKDQVQNHAKQSGGVISPGDVMYKDLYHDGVIDGKDRTYLGTWFPKMTFGFNITANWKGFDLGAFFQGALGVKNYVTGNMLGGIGGDVNKPTSIFLDRWTSGHPSATFPRLWVSYSNNRAFSSFWLRNASYLRMKNLQLGYNLPASAVHRLGLENIKVYYSGQNLLTFSQFYKWVDPETPQGEAGYTYPQTKINTIGINITF